MRENIMLSECKSYFIFKTSECHNRILHFVSYYQMYVKNITRKSKKKKKSMIMINRKNITPALILVLMFSVLIIHDRHYSRWHAVDDK